jgi:hypothetical protein
MNRIFAMFGVGALAFSINLPAVAGPLPPIKPQQPTAAEAQATPARDSWAGGNASRWRLHGGWNHHWSHGNWRGGHNWHHGWHRHWHGGWGPGRWDDGDDFSGFVPGLALGLGLGYFGNHYFAPRHATNAHVRWCYNHYRSYRARQQCIAR